MSAPIPPTATAELERLLAAAVSGRGGDAAVDEFCAALLNANVGWLVVTDDAGRSAPMTVPHADGELVAFFSGPERVAHALETLQRPELQAQVLPCRALWQMSVRNGAGTLLNPLSTPGKSFTVDEMSDLLNGVRPGTRTRTVAADSGLVVSELELVPQFLDRALIEHVTALGGVRSATLAAVRYPDGLAGLIFVVVTDLPRERVLDGIEAAAALTGGETLDVVVTADQLEADGLVAGVAPLYVAG